MNTIGSISANVKALAMLGHSKLLSPEQKYSKRTKDKIMNLSTKEISQPEQVTNYEQKADTQHASPSIRQCSVSGGVSVVHCKKAKYDVYIGRPSKWGNPFTNRPGTTQRQMLYVRCGI